jgi:tetratricopeptide (TPR) repeat protein
LTTTSDYNEELGLLRRAVAEPVRQLIVVEFDILARLHQALHELAALDPKRAHVIQKFDFRKDTAAGLLQISRERLKAAPGSRPAFLALVGPDEIESEPGAPASQRFWKEMNLAREALNTFDAQILLCLERWSYRQALLHADHLLSWAGMKIHLMGSIERPAVADRTVLSAGLFGDYKLSPPVARERWNELEQAWHKAKEQGEPAEGFLKRFFIPMLEAALALGDLVLARKTRELALEQSRFPDEDMPRWHELNLALALAGHEEDLANEHAYKLLDLAENHPDERLRERALMAVNNQANLLADTASYALAEPLYRKSLALTEKIHGPEHPNVAIHLSNLARLLHVTNRTAEAEPFMRRALAIDEKNFGLEHPEVATALNNLAQLLHYTNRTAEAEPLMRHALVIDEKNLGPDHPMVAVNLSNLASLLCETNRLAEAEPLVRRALAIDEKNFGPDHPNVAIRLNNLAQLLQNTSRSAEAEPLMRKALTVLEKTLGENHPKVATALNNLAELQRVSHRLAEAEPLYRRALSIDEEGYGQEHPDVARDLHNLSLLLKETRRLKEAEPLSRRAAGILARSLGPEHPISKITLDVYKSILSDMKLSEPEIQAKLRAVTEQ